MTLMRKKRSSRKRPSSTAVSRSRLVAATRRTSNGTSSSPPTGRTDALLQRAQELRLQGERQLADLVEEERAAVRLRRRGRVRGARASVKAPRAWPKSSLSSSVSGIAAQLTATNGLVARAGSRRCSARATSSLPVPLSPVIRTDASVSATRSSSSCTAAHRRAVAEQLVEAVRRRRPRWRSRFTSSRSGGAAPRARARAPARRSSTGLVMKS